MKVEHTEVIEHPAAEVFKAFEDPAVIAAWQKNMLEFEQVKGSFQKKGGVARMKVKQVGMTNDLTVTTAGTVPNVGDTVVVKGTVALNKDFGMGYQYDIIVEDAEVTVEANGS